MRGLSFFRAPSMWSNERFSIISTTMCFSLSRPAVIAFPPSLKMCLVAACLCDHTKFLGGKVEHSRSPIASDYANDQHADQAVRNHRMRLRDDGKHAQPNQDNRANNTHKTSPPNGAAKSVACGNPPGHASDQAERDHQPQRNLDGDAL